LLLALTLLAGCREEPLPEMLTIGRFALTDQDGRTFGTEDLHGKVWVADFVFTSCPDVCPVLTSQMANLARRVDGEDVRFVSITVDPATDTPDKLREYAARFHADTTRWRFLTGSPDDVRAVIERDFRLPVGEREGRGDGRYDIMHGNRFVLVDRRGILRGLYETNGDGLERLEHDIARLEAE
jgi:protein SCO1/2